MNRACTVLNMRSIHEPCLLKKTFHTNLRVSDKYTMHKRGLPHDEADIASGFNLGLHFEFFLVLGEGSYGVTCLMREITNNRYIAVKACFHYKLRRESFHRIS